MPEPERRQSSKLDVETIYIEKKKSEEEAKAREFERTKQYDQRKREQQDREKAQRELIQRITAIVLIIFVLVGVYLVFRPF